MAYNIEPLRSRCESVEKILSEAGAKGYICFRKVKRALDFGSGDGGSTAALFYFTKPNETTVQAVELNTSKVHSLRSLRLLRNQDIISGDGIAHLMNLQRNGLPLCGLVTTFGLMVFGREKILSDLITACATGLNGPGNLLIQSGASNMQRTVALCERSGAPYHPISIMGTLTASPISAVIIPQSSCRLIAAS